MVAFKCSTLRSFFIFSWQNAKFYAFHSFFSRKRVKSVMLSLFSRNEKWICFSFHSFWEWKVKWKCLEIEIESEKWNENASRSRSRSEIGKKFSRILEKRDSRRVLGGTALTKTCFTFFCSFPCTPAITKTDEFSEKFWRGGGEIIFNPKIYVAKFGPLKSPSPSGSSHLGVIPTQPTADCIECPIDFRPSLFLRSGSPQKLG